MYHSIIDMKPFEALFGRWHRSPIGLSGVLDVKPLGGDLVKDAQDKVLGIQSNLLDTQTRQKKYIDHKVRYMEFQDGEIFILKVSPIKGVMRFDKKVNLNPWYIGPVKVL